MTPKERNLILRLSKSKRPMVSIKGRLWNWPQKFSGVLPSWVSNSKEPLDHKLLEWIRRLESTRILTPSRASEVEWTRHYIQPSVTLFRSSHCTERSLIVSFTGLARRMMMSMPDYLDAVSDLSSDVLVLHGSDRFGYLNKGIDGVGHDLLDGIGSVSNLVQKLGYKVRYIIGTSAGGLPAVVAMSYFEGVSALVVGPQKISHELIPDSWRTRIESIELSVSSSSLKVVVGSDAPTQDHVAAKELQRASGSTTLVVPNAGHSPLRPLLNRHLLINILEA
jgi:hypothetical protein